MGSKRQKKAKRQIMEHHHLQGSNSGPSDNLPDAVTTKPLGQVDNYRLFFKQ